MQFARSTLIVVVDYRAVCLSIGLSSEKRNSKKRIRGVMFNFRLVKIEIKILQPFKCMSV